MNYNHRDLDNKIDFSDFSAVRLSVASREDIISWSHGEVLKPETINYRTQKPEKDGLFCEKIFGPVKNINPHDTRAKAAYARSLAVDKKGAIVTKSIVRRERMGHIQLAVPVAHIWFLRVAPSALGNILGLTIKSLEKVIYFISYFILEVNKDLKTQVLAEMAKAYEAAHKLLLETPITIEEVQLEVFEYFLKESQKQGVLPDFDIWDLLLKFDENYAQADEILENLRQHNLLSFARAQALDNEITNLYKIFQNCRELNKIKNPKKLYSEFLAETSPKNASIKGDLRSEFRKIKKLFDSLWRNVQIPFEDFNDLYDSRRDKIKEGLVKYGLISEADYRDLPLGHRKIIKVGMGGEVVAEALRSININQLIKELKTKIEQGKGQKQLVYYKRLKTLEGMQRANINIEGFCLTFLPVIPPNLRPIIQLSGGRFATSDLNDLYRRVINRNNRLKELQELKAPEVICRNEKRMLQEAVDALLDNSQQRSARQATTGSQQRKLKSLADILKRKQGRLRQNLLGKRVDYSGRSVIVIGPDLKISECGLPKIMALELFKPFVIGYLINNDYASNVPIAKRLIEGKENIVWDALDQVIQGKLVLLNRAPSLHRLSVQAFKPKLIEGKAIQLHPLVCKGFNADFDGDNMAVHLPLSDIAQKEAADLMVPAKNLLHPADGTPILYFDQDIIMGLYYLTYIKDKSEKATRAFTSLEEAIFAYDRGLIQLQTPIIIVFRGERRETTIGRVILNELFPEDFPYQECAMGKDAVKLVMATVYEMYDNDTTVRIADMLKDLAFQYATKSGVSVGMDDFFQVKGYEELQEQGVLKAIKINNQYHQGLITDKERHRLIVNNWFEIDKLIQVLVDEQFVGQDSCFKLIVDSKARGTVNLGQIKRMMVSTGVMTDTSGNALELSINSNLYKGLPILEYFVAARGARKSLIDVALSTADSGHLTRKLVYVAQDVITIPDDEQIVDPGFPVSRSLSEEVGSTLYKRLLNRYAAEDIKLNGEYVVRQGELITKIVAEAIETSDLAEVKILSGLSSPNLRGIPTKSYGIDLANGELVHTSHPIGVIAAQSIGEPSTQLKLDSKHGGGLAIATQHMVSTGLNRVEELFETRPPKGQAYMAPFGGYVSVTELHYDYEIIVKADAEAIWRLAVDGADVVVKLDQIMKAGELVAVKKNNEAILAPVEGAVESIKANEVVIKPLTPPEVRFLIAKSQQLLVENGQTVEKGAQINEGSFKLDELLKLNGVTDTQTYILTETLKVFSLQGVHIADKHLEAIIRQMFSRMQIIDAGDSRFVEGDIVSRQTLTDANKDLKQTGKKQAIWCQLVLGITKINCLSDSFLVAASFQDTTRILVSSAINGRIDYLRGLIENVILGRKIPIGTGTPSENPIDADFK